MILANIRILQDRSIVNNVHKECIKTKKDNFNAIFVNLELIKIQKAIFFAKIAYLATIKIYKDKKIANNAHWERIIMNLDN